MSHQLTSCSLVLLPRYCGFLKLTLTVFLLDGSMTSLVGATEPLLRNRPKVQTVEAELQCPVQFSWFQQVLTRPHFLLAPFSDVQAASEGAPTAPPAVWRLTSIGWGRPGNAEPPPPDPVIHT